MVEWTDDGIRQRAAELFGRVWILSDGKIGDLVQCRGVAQALGLEAEERIVSPQKPWVWAMPRGPLPPKDRIDSPTSPLAGELPDLVIASGWRTLAYVREIKKAADKPVFSVFLKNPRIFPGYLDLIWAPVHDNISGERVITTLASPHRFSREVLVQKYGRQPDFLKELPRPLATVMIGGDSNVFTFTKEEDCQRLPAALRALAALGCGLAVTPSRRTPEHVKRAVREGLKGTAHFWWDGTGDNPYGYMLAHADYIVATADSANMMAEGCVTGKPIYYYTPSGGSKKFNRLHEKLAEHGATRPLPDRIEKLDQWEYEPLYAAAEIAAEIIKRAGG